LLTGGNLELGFEKRLCDFIADRSGPTPRPGLGSGRA